MFQRKKEMDYEWKKTVNEITDTTAAIRNNKQK
jgi:hypothetical protein